MAARQSDSEQTWKSISVPQAEAPSLELLNDLLTRGIEATIREADEVTTSGNSD